MVLPRISVHPMKKKLSYLRPQKKCYFTFSGTVTSTKTESNTLREGLSGS